MPVIKTVNKKSQIKEYTDADNNQSPAIYNKIASMYDAIIGSSLQVQNGAATHTTFLLALSQISSGGRILVLKGTYTENVTVSKQCTIEGQGHSTTITGNFILNGGSDYTSIRDLRFYGNLTLNSNGNFVRECFQSTGKTITDNGTANSILIVQE